MLPSAEVMVKLWYTANQDLSQIWKGLGLPCIGNEEFAFRIPQNSSSSPVLSSVPDAKSGVLGTSQDHLLITNALKLLAVFTICKTRDYTCACTV